MSNLVIECTTGSGTIRYGIYGGNQINPYDKGTFVKAYMTKVEYASDGSHIKLSFADSSTANLSWNDPEVDYTQPVNGLAIEAVDLVNSTAPTDQEHLFELMTALMG